MKMWIRGVLVDGVADVAKKVPIKWESVDVTPTFKDGKQAIPDDAIESVTKNYVALKGPLAVRHPPYPLRLQHH
jgi:hypothetical protein